MSATLAEVLAEALRQHEPTQDGCDPYGLVCSDVDHLSAAASEAVLAWLEGLLGGTVLAFDYLEDDVPAGVDVPDDYEWGMHDAASVILAAAREGVRDE